MDGWQTGREAVAAKGWFLAHKWLLLRRLSQILIFALFLLGPLTGFWFIAGNLNSSLILDFLPLTDPFVALQVFLAGSELEPQALYGVAVVVVVYMLVGGRVYCSWVCPINMITDTAAWLRRGMGIGKGLGLSRTTRYWLLAMSLILPTVGGQLYWELINPVTIFQRGLIFGLGSAWLIVAMVFLFDLFVSSAGWCGRLCPMGAFYALFTTVSPVRVSAKRREDCNDCLDCFRVCPEPQVIKPALKGSAMGHGPTVQNINCSNCGRCIDVCAPDVFEFAIHLPDKLRISL